MPFRATIQREVYTTDRSGQRIVSGYTETPIKRCLFLVTSGNRKSTAKETYEEAMAFYTTPDVDLREGDRIIDIRRKNGATVEAGPYEVHSVKQVPTLSGKVHHLSCKLKGVG